MLSAALAVRPTDFVVTGRRHKGKMMRCVLSVSVIIIVRFGGKQYLLMREVEGILEAIKDYCMLRQRARISRNIRIVLGNRDLIFSEAMRKSLNVEMGPTI